MAASGLCLVPLEIQLNIVTKALENTSITIHTYVGDPVRMKVSSSLPLSILAVCHAWRVAALQDLSEHLTIDIESPIVMSHLDILIPSRFLRIAPILCVRLDTNSLEDPGLNQDYQDASLNKERNLRRLPNLKAVHISPTWFNHSQFLYKSYSVSEMNAFTDEQCLDAVDSDFEMQAGFSVALLGDVRPDLKITVDATLCSMDSTHTHSNYMDVFGTKLSHGEWAFKKEPAHFEE